MRLTKAWEKSDSKWLIDGVGSGGNPFHGFVEVNNQTGDAEEMACLLVRALDYYQRHVYLKPRWGKPLWEVLGTRMEPIFYYTEKPDLSKEPNLDALLTLDGKPMPRGVTITTIKTTGFRMCYDLPSWWEAR